MVGLQYPKCNITHLQILLVTWLSRLLCLLNNFLHLFPLLTRQHSDHDWFISFSKVNYVNASMNVIMVFKRESNWLYPRDDVYVLTIHYHYQRCRSCSLCVIAQCTHFTCITWNLIVKREGDTWDERQQRSDPTQQCPIQFPFSILILFFQMKNVLL